MAAATVRTRLLILGTARPGLAWAQGRDRALHICLGPLPDAEARQLALAAAPDRIFARRSPAQQAGGRPGRRAGHPLEVLARLDRDLPARLHLPGRRGSPAAPARARLGPGRADPGHRPGAAAAPARHRHPAAPARLGPPAALVG